MTTPPINYPVELLHDGKGVYGIGVTKEAEIDPEPKDLMIRRDRLSESDPYCRAALQLITGGFRQGMFTRMSEERFRQVSHHGMLRRTGLGWPPYEDSSGPPWWSPDHEQQVRNRRTFHGLRLGSLSIVNRLIGQALEEAADPEAVTLARRFPFRNRYAVYRATALSPRTMQIMAAFPTLGLAIYVRPAATCERDAATFEWDAARRAWDAATDRSREAMRLVENGARLNEIAKLMRVPLAFRKVKPGAADMALDVGDAFDDMRLLQAHMPDSLPKMRQWLHCIHWAKWAGPDFVRWTAKHGLEIGGSTREAISRLSDIRDWVYACNCLNVPVDVPEGDRRPYDSGRGEQFVVRRFSPDMSLATASGLSSDWHEAVAANMSGPNAEFPEPWCPGAESCGFNIAPITTNSELYREGALLHHCVGTHADRVQFGDAYIYSVRRSCERVATLELVRSGSGVVIGELRGPCNSQVPKEVERAVKSWLRAQREFRFPLSEPDRRNSSTSPMCSLTTTTSLFSERTMRDEAKEFIVALIDSAEEVRDPLDGLVAKTATDPGAPFMPEVLEALVALKANDRAAFEALRAQLKVAGCRITALDHSIAEDIGETVGRRQTQGDVLIKLARSAELFHTTDGCGFADLDVNGHRETWPIRSKGFRLWLARLYFEATNGAPSSEALHAALNVIAAKAHFDAPERAVYVRVGELDGRLYLDLCDKTWRAVEIDATGWRVIDHPPVRFRRASGMRPLPVPEPGGTIDALRPFLNIKFDREFVLVVAWALACLRNRGPYPVIALSGEQGSAKSTFLAILRALLDPNTAPLRALPREDRDLFIAASNGHVLAFDNVSGLPPWISDTLCRLATGGGFAARQLYSDQDEVLFDAARPVILNGIEDIVTRPDLADRALFLTLEPIPEERRRPETELWAAFETERPRILGALLNAVAEGLKRLPKTHLPKLPRMADFALWATACETALWPPGTFWSAYCGNLGEAVESVIDADPVAAAVRAMTVTRAEWTGTASDLLVALGETVGERVVRSKTWPDSPRALAGRLHRAATFLRKTGIEISFEREGRARTRVIHITATGQPIAPETEGAQPSPFVPCSYSQNANQPNDFAEPGMRTVSDPADGSNSGIDSTVRANAMKSQHETDADDADANIPPLSAPKNAGWRARK